MEHLQKATFNLKVKPKMLKNPNPKNVKRDNKGRDTALLYFTLSRRTCGFSIKIILK